MMLGRSSHISISTKQYICYILNIHADKAHHEAGSGYLHSFIHECIMYMLTFLIWYYIAFHGQFKSIRHAIKNLIDDHDHGHGFSVHPWNAATICRPRT